MNGIELAIAEPSFMLERFFSALIRKHGPYVKVVVLIDEYDSPIQSVIADPIRADENRKVLHSFYNTLKSLSDEGMIRFLFVTGVTKFAKASFFSVFNQCHDLTLDRAYAGVCGFTHQEFEQNLARFLPEILEFQKSKNIAPASTTVAEFKQQVYDYYDGYSWDGETRVFNPFSLVNFLSSKILDSYWYYSGTPTFLMNLIRSNPLEFSRSESYPLNKQSLEDVDIGNLNLTPLLFQTGYLTVDSTTDYVDYQLREPNREVSVALNTRIVETLTSGVGRGIKALGQKLQRALDEKDTAALAECFEEILNWIPHEIHLPLESYYHSVIFAVLKALSFKARSEVSTSEGRMDLRLEFSKGKLYILEFKFEKFPPEKKMKSVAAPKTRNKTSSTQNKQKKIKSEDELKASLMAEALKKAQSQLMSKGYAKGDEKEYQEVFQVAVGIVGRSMVGAELVPLKN
jgi:hypothetical protein